ncbi:hypothetical protein LZ31DRAFT_375941 [Colletotrichum somersetense]|nr:hypothetical protein LZ31DRAFT_375941 [Colletotrichum somersetense]
MTLSNALGGGRARELMKQTVVEAGSHQRLSNRQVYQTAGLADLAFIPPVLLSVFWSHLFGEKDLDGKKILGRCVRAASWRASGLPAATASRPGWRSTLAERPSKTSTALHKSFAESHQSQKPTISQPVPSE